MNWLGSSTASHSTPEMPDTASSSTCVSMWCRPWPNSWNSVITSSCVSSAGRWPSRTGGAKLHTRCATGVCSAPSGRRQRAAHVVHPGAGALAGAGVQVQVELADQLRPLAAALDAEEAHAVVPDRRAVGADAHVEQRLDHAEQALQHARLGEVLLDLLLAEGVARLLQLLGGEGHVPGLQVGQAELARGEFAQLGQVALGEAAGRAAPGRAGSRCTCAGDSAIFGTSDSSA